MTENGANGRVFIIERVILNKIFTSVSSSLDMLKSETRSFLSHSE